MNNMKTFILMMVLSGLLIVIGFAIGGVPLLNVFLILALGMNSLLIGPATRSL